MSDKKKLYVSLWVKTDKNGNPFLSGKDKASDTRYFVFTNKEGEKILKKSVGKDGDIEDIGTLVKGSNDFGTFLKYESMFVSENQFYDEGDPYMTRKNGEYVLNTDGEKIPAPEYTLSMPS